MTVNGMSQNNQVAVVLAGGKGTRLKPFTGAMPKPLVPVGDRPIIEILLAQLRRGGITRVHMAVHHLSHLIMAVLGDGRRLNLDISYSLEKSELSTVGPIKLISDLPETFLVCNGDILTDLNVSRLFESHVSRKARLTIATTTRTEQMDYGIIETDDDGIVSGFSEKPEHAYTVSMGLYVFSRSLLDLVPDGRPYGIDNLMLDLLSAGERINTYSYDGYWLDIGRPADYERAQRDIERIDSLMRQT
jgi:NDP-sugar pyrophosphorylase family protein